MERDSEPDVALRQRSALPGDVRAAIVQRTQPFPDFFVLGAAKCGTTSLHAWLDQHPDILMSHPKEPCFFEAEYERGGAFYWNRYFGHWQGQARVGESRHRNLYLPYVPGRIHAFNPDARLVVILREPVARAYSHWWHWYRRGQERLPFPRAAREDLERIERGERVSEPEEIEAYAHGLDPDRLGPHRTYLDSGYYAEQIERYLRLFPRDRLLVLRFEALVRDPTRQLERVLRFLDVDPTPARRMDLRQHNRANRISWRRTRRLALRRLVAEAGWRPWRLLSRAVRGAALSRPPMDPDTRGWLREHYRGHNKRLEDLLGMRLHDWDG